MRRFLPAALFALLIPFSLGAGPVARVLDEDPPLPGEPLTGWEALAPPATSGDLLTGLLTVDAAVALALANPPELAALRAEVTAARGALLEVRALPSPSVEVALLTVEGGQVDRAPANLAARLDLTDILEGRLAASAARPEVDAARLRLEEAEIRLRYEAKAAYYDHQAALAAWGASLRTVDALAASRDAQRAITAAGNGPGRDLAIEEMAYEEARLRAAELELQIIETRERFSRMLGRDPGPLAPAPPLEAWSLPEDIERAVIARSLALRSLDLEIAAAERRQTAARVQGLAPEVEIFAEAERRERAWESALGVELSLPSSGRGERVGSRAEVERLRAQRVQAEREVRSSARETELRLASAVRRARHVQDVLLPARERVLAETLLHYNAMQLGLDALLDAWRGRAEVEALAADARREALTARAAMDALLAGARVDAPRAAASPSSNPNDPGGH